jgi:hypothetical protein
MSSNPMIVSFRASPGGIIPRPCDGSNSALDNATLASGASLQHRATPEPQAQRASGHIRRHVDHILVGVRRRGANGISVACWLTQDFGIGSPVTTRKLSTQRLSSAANGPSRQTSAVYLCRSPGGPTANIDVGRGRSK